MTEEQLAILRDLALRKNYVRGPNHAKQVRELSLKIYSGLAALGMLKKASQDIRVLEAAALLHDIGLPKEPHNVVGFDLLSSEMPRLTAAIPLSPVELQMILYCVLWHRGQTFAKRGDVDITDLAYTRKMAAILRVGDALDRTLQQAVTDVALTLAGKDLVFALSSKLPIQTEIGRAEEKADLLKDAYGLTEVSFRHVKKP